MKNKSFLKIGVFGFLATSSLLLFNNPSAVEANDDVTTPTHIGTYDGSTTFTTSSSNGVNPALFIEVIDKNGNLVQYESEDGVITVENTRAGAYVTQAKLFGKTMYRDLDTGELLESWEEGRNLELESSKMPVLTTTGKNLFNDDLLVNKDIIINIDGVDVYKPIITSSYEFGVTSDSGFRLKNNIFKDNTQYTLSFKFIENSSSALHKQIIYRYTDRDTYQSWSEREGVVRYTTKANKTLETISVISRNTDGTNFGIYDVQLEDGSVLTDYEPYKSNILTVNEDVTLRGIGDVKDELNLLTGELTQRIGEKIFENNKTYRVAIDDNTPNIIHVELDCDANEYQINQRGGANPLTNVIPDNPINRFSDDKEGVYVDANGYLVLCLSREKAKTQEEFGVWLQQNPITVQYKLATDSIKTVDLKASDYFSPETTAQISIEGETVPLIASITVPTETLSFVIDPNQEAGKQFIAPEFSVTNDTYAPLRLEIKSFSQVTNKMNDVLPSKYSDWDVLNKTESNDIALGIIPQGGDGWKSLTEGARYVADDSNYELGVIKPTETVDFKFSALHGPTILKPLNLKYELSFIFDFE